MDRRYFLELARYAALCAAVPNDWRVEWRPRFVDDPFSLGVASGDPTPSGVMLWTRLAPRPDEPDSGMLGQRPVVSWEVADDENFAKVVQKGRATAAPELGYSVHADVQGLGPDRWYFYRFTTGDARSITGRTRTAPAEGALTPLTFAFISCQHFEQGLYTAFDHLSRENLDLVAHLGDYIYEYGPTDGRVRRHGSSEVRTLEEYRARYAQYKGDAFLRAAHARCPWILTWDDHEVDNNYAGLVGENDMESEEQMHVRRAAAYQAWWENQPVRVKRALSWADLTITRTVNWGALARFWVLDTRQYRSDQACDDGQREVPCGNWADPSRTLMGAAQEKWFADGLERSRSRWQVVAQQIMMAPYDMAPGGKRSYHMDSWGGYPAALERMLHTIGTRAENRTVVLSGDIHSNWVNELRTPYATPQGKTVAAEFVGTSMTSGGDGSEGTASVERNAGENPHMKWHNNRRGYVRCQVSPDQWTADYRTVPFVSKPGAPIGTASSWLARNGKPGIEKA